jgi:hypothetical protein
MILPMHLVEDVPCEAREVNIFTTVGEVPKAAAISVPRTLYDDSRSEMLLGFCCGQRSIASIYVLSIEEYLNLNSSLGTEKAHPISMYPVKVGHCKCFPSKCTSEL